LFGDVFGRENKQIYKNNRLGVFMEHLILNPRDVDFLPTNFELHLKNKENCLRYSYLEKNYFDVGDMGNMPSVILFENLRGELPLVYDGNHRFVLAFERDVGIPGVIVDYGEKFFNPMARVTRIYDMTLFEYLWAFRVECIKNGLHSFKDVHWWRGGITRRRRG
jgi:hypothetical protein